MGDFCVIFVSAVGLARMQSFCNANRQSLNKFVRLCNTRTKMHAGRVACCPLLSHVEYPPSALLRLEKDGTDRLTDGRQTVTVLLPLDAAA